MKARKIRISGGSGSGKTYLGRQLSELTGVPLTSLDAITYDFSKTHRFEHRRSLDECNRLLDEVVSKDDWIIEGGYYKYTKHTYDDCDLLILLRPSFTMRLWNTLRRFVIRIGRGEFEGLWNFLCLTAYNFRSIRKWQKERQELFSKLYPRKLHLFGSADDALEWFTDIYTLTRFS